MKKNSKKKSEETKPAVVENKRAPEVEQGSVNVPFNSEELSNYFQLMTLLAQGLSELALSAAKNNDEKSFSILSSRAQLSSLLASKLHSHAKIGEPSSKEIH